MKSLCSYCRHRWSSLRRRPPPSRFPLLSSSTHLRSFKRCFNEQPPSFLGVFAKRSTGMDVNDKHNGSQPYTVFIEGNVGSGKTTFLEQFADCPNVFMAKEPVHKWQDVRGHNFLVGALRIQKIKSRTLLSDKDRVCCVSIDVD